MDDEVRRWLTRHFDFYEEEGDHYVRRLYRTCMKAYVVAGCPYGDRAMMLW